MQDFQPWVHKQDAVLKALGSGELGLTEEKAKSCLEKYGFNELKRVLKKGVFRMFAGQFTNFLVILLIIAAIIAFSFGEVLDAGFIFLIIVINAVFGFVQEFKAENALEALKKLAAPQAKVIRNGKVFKIDSKLLVPGDVIELEEGDKIPADCRLLEAYSFETIESALTGESQPVVKDAKITLKENTQVADRVNMAFSGTSVAKGRATAVITETGMETEFGKIAAMVSTISEERTPLEDKLETLGKRLGLGAIAVCILVFIAGLIYGRDLFTMFFISVSLLVAAVPEGLPAVVTVTLALGVQRMVRKKSVVRKLPAVETLGSTTFICSDKTGTLTQNQMTARVVSLSDVDTNISSENLVKSEKNFVTAMKISALCNNAKVIEEETVHGLALARSGDPTEVALLLLAKQAGITKENLELEFEFLSELSFDPDRKMMSVIYKDKDKKLFAFVKGAPERVIENSEKILTKTGVKTLDVKDKRGLLAKNDELASRALRVIALAYAPVRAGTEFKPAQIEKNLIFVGLVGIIDPPRPEVKDAVRLCKQAGISVVMITGDNERTARAIAEELEIMDGGKVISGYELDKMSDEALEKEVESVKVFARVNPRHKLRIVNALQKNGEIVAMTGDGVNDAPALKKADIGISMGRTGTEVARESSKMVLLDDNFATIVTAVEEGRKIYDNVAKSVRFLVSCNLGEIFTVFIPTVIPFIFGGALPLTPVQILWTNVATDSMPALALGTDTGDPGAMKQPPRDPNEEIIGFKNVSRVFGVALLIGVATLLVFLYALQFGAVVASTMAFSTLVAAQMSYALSALSKKLPLYKTDIFENKFLIFTILLSLTVQFAIVQFGFANAIFDTVALSIEQWLVVFGASLLVLLIVELYKVLKINNGQVTRAV